MIDFLIYLMKVIIVFISSGTATLIAYYALKECRALINFLLVKYNLIRKVVKLEVVSRTRVSPNSAFYEISYGDRKRIKVFSSPTGIKLI